MISEYINAVLRQARYEILPDDNAYYGEIAGFQGVYATGQTLEECRAELIEVLEEWLLLSVAKNLPVPIVDGINLQILETV